MINRVGQRLGNYYLTRLLGRGGFADVYLGEHMYLKTQSAIKILHARLDSATIDLFLTEARHLSLLAHPHIVRILDFGIEDEIPFLVMDYVPNGTLRERHANKIPVPLPTVVSYARQIADALYYAHDNKVIHQDLKPENVLIGHDDLLLLSDFGVALATPTTEYTNAQATGGTLLYMSPERLRGKPQPGSDQYALGVMTYEWLSGERPFQGTPAELCYQHLFVPPPSLRAKAFEISQDVEQVVLKALSKDPQVRFVDVLSFVSALELASQSVTPPHILPVVFSARLGNPVLSPDPMDVAVEMPLPALPAPLTSLIGRDEERRAACVLLVRPNVRLLTLTGTAGIGKTHLALSIAHDMQQVFTNGTCLVSLVAVNDPDLVIPSIAKTFGLRESADRTFFASLKAFLRDKHLLLVLDNFEQVTAAAPFLTQLLEACPQLTMLVTSRAVLHVRGEHEFPLPPLECPDLKALPDLETLAQCASVALFLQCSQAVKPDFQLTDSNARTIAEICVKLDGLPLTLELAAARIKLLTPTALLARLEHRLTLLTSGRSDAPTHQQTLRHTLQWSYDLLDADEQRLFLWLSVFIGGCTLEAIEAIVPNSAGGSILEKATSLLDKSLLQQATQGDDEDVRLILLETIREFGLEHLGASGEIEQAQRVHASYYLALAEQGELALYGIDQGIWLKRLEREQGNLLAALRWSIDHQEREVALRLSGPLVKFWQLRNYLREALPWLETVLKESEGVVVGARARVLTGTGMCANVLGNPTRAEKLGLESLPYLQEQGDTHFLVCDLWLLGRLAIERNEYAKAQMIGEQMLTMARAGASTWGTGHGFIILGLIAFFQGDYAKSCKLHQEALANSRKVGDALSMAIAQRFIAETYFARGDLEEAQTWLTESFTLNKTVGIEWEIGWTLGLFGHIALQQGDTAKAHSLLEESLRINQSVGDQQGCARTYSLLARLALLKQDHVMASALYHQSLQIALKFTNRWHIASYLEGLAEVAANQGKPDWAVRLWGTAEAVRRSIGTPMLPIEQTSYKCILKFAQDSLGDKVFTQMWNSGQAMTPEQALEQEQSIEGILTEAQGTNGSSNGTPGNGTASLSKREIDVLRLVAQGHTNAQIAEQLVLSIVTVNSYLRSVYRKLGISSRTQATRYAIDYHYI